MYNCLDTLGKLPWPQASKSEIWAVLLEKVFHLSIDEIFESDHKSHRPHFFTFTSSPQLFQQLGQTSGEGESKAPLNRLVNNDIQRIFLEIDNLMLREKLMLLANLLPAVAEANPDLIDVHEDSIDGISILGSSMEVSKAASVALVQRYIEKNKVVPSSEVLPGSRVISSTEVASLGNLLCGLTDYQWLELITVDIFASTLVDHLANLDCAISEPVKDHLASLLLEVFFFKLRVLCNSNQFLRSCTEIRTPGPQVIYILPDGLLLPWPPGFDFSQIWQYPFF